ncbi:MAG: hypothetical protein L0H93_04405 [Nocardioides sp.]|nr:hypothetical protein [Nocardioides sp.]
MKNLTRVGAVAAGISLIAVAATSGATAAKWIDGSDIKRGTVAGKQIKDSSIASRDIANGKIRVADLAPWVQKQVRSGGADGVAGEQGPKGEAGAPGADGMTGYEVIGRGPDAAVGTGEPQVIEAECASGQSVISGGIRSGGAGVTGQDVTMHEAYPSGVTEVTLKDNRPEGDEAGIWTSTSWSVEFTAAEGTAVQAFVICSDVTFDADDEFLKPEYRQAG